MNCYPSHDRTIWWFENVRITPYRNSFRNIQTKSYCWSSWCSCQSEWKITEFKNSYHTCVWSFEENMYQFLLKYFLVALVSSILTKTCRGSHISHIKQTSIQKLIFRTFENHGSFLTQNAQRHFFVSSPLDVAENFC